MRFIKLLAIIVCIMLSTAAFTQSIGKLSFYQKTGYKETKARVLDKGKIENAQWCYIIENGKIVQFSPDELTRYGLERGSIYYSREIQSDNIVKKVFLELITNGEVNLFYYKSSNKSTFFVESEKFGIIEIPENTTESKNVFRNLLKEILKDNEASSTNCQFVSYNKVSLKRLIDGYNSRSKRELERLKFGIYGGIIISKLSSSYKPGNVLFANIDHRFIAKPNLGISVNIPLGSGKFSIYSEMHFSKYSYQGEGISTSSYLYSYGEINTISMPALLRYNKYLWNIKSYIGAGPVFSTNSSSNYLYRVRIESGDVNIYLMDDYPAVSKMQAGICTAAGIEIPINNSFSLTIAAKYTYLVSTSPAASYDISTIQFLTGINF